MNDHNETSSPGRVDQHLVLGPLTEAVEVVFHWRGQPITAREGEPIGVALWAAGVVALGANSVSGDPRGMYCAIGHCMACRVTVDGVRGVRACLTPVRGGEQVEPC